MRPTGHPEAPDRVLSTLNKDGSRRWLDPRVSRGRFLTWRRVVAYLLLILYNALPWIEINGKPAMLLDIGAREFTFFGATFLPTDTLLLMLFVAAVFVAIFFVTALFGRIWCGWACPQTVYMEFIFRPIERFFLGRTPARRKQHAKTMPIRRVLMYATFLVFAFHLANTFLSYFVGAKTVFHWTLGSPFNHFGPFLLVLFVTGLIMLDFGFLREQICIVMCPYGRFQSVMLDRSSLLISYDTERGEPRKRKGSSRPGDEVKDGGSVSLPVANSAGDCIDCFMCVTTCPTGIDIRDGLQMECIGCAQCIDACDAVMTKIGKPRGLIRYTSQEAMEHKRWHLLRPRVIIYPVILAVLVSMFVFVLLTRAEADVTVLRASMRPYVTLSDGNIANEISIKIVNRVDRDKTFTFALENLDEARFTVEESPLVVAPGETVQVVGTIVAPPTSFRNGKATITVLTIDEQGEIIRRTCRVQGPWGVASSKKDSQS